MNDYYSILGINRDANKDEIKQAYRKMVKQYHPDINKSPEAEDKLKEINRAYEMLTKQKPEDFEEMLKSYGFTSVNFSNVFNFSQNIRSESKLAINFDKILNSDDINKILKAIYALGYKSTSHSYTGRN